MSLLPGVKIKHKITGDLLLESPGFFSLPPVGSDLFLSEDGGTPSQYVVKHVCYFLDVVHHEPSEGGASKTSVNGHVLIQVQ